MAGTGNPVPSDALIDLKENSQVFDRVVNSDSETVVGRVTDQYPSGKELLTIIGMNAAATTGNPAVGAAQAALDYKNEAQTYAEAAATNADWVYSSVADGEAARVDGDYFWVVSADNSEVLELWLMGVSTATDTGKRTINKNYLKHLKSPVSYANIQSNEEWIAREGIGSSINWQLNSFGDNTELLFGESLAVYERTGTDPSSARTVVGPFASVTPLSSLYERFCLHLNYKASVSSGTPVQILARWEENGVLKTNNFYDLTMDGVERSEIFDFKFDPTKTITNIRVRLANGEQGDIVKISYCSFFLGGRYNAPYEQERLSSEILSEITAKELSYNAFKNAQGKEYF